MSEERKPCPFCGEKNTELLTQIRSEPLDITVSVRCNTCGSAGAETYIEFNQMRNPHPEAISERLLDAAETALDDWDNRK